MGCAFYCAARMKSSPAAWNANLCGIGVISVLGIFNTFYVGKVEVPAYPHWRSDYENPHQYVHYTFDLANLLDKDVRDPKARLTGGYLDEIYRRVPAHRDESIPPFALVEPDPVWHTWITGKTVRPKKVRLFRCWLPSGSLETASLGARLVEVDRLGKPLDPRKPHGELLGMFTSYYQPDVY